MEKIELSTFIYPRWSKTQTGANKFYLSGVINPNGMTVVAWFSTIDVLKIDSRRLVFNERRMEKMKLTAVVCFSTDDILKR